MGDVWADEVGVAGLGEDAEVDCAGVEGGGVGVGGGGGPDGVEAEGCEAGCVFSHCYSFFGGSCQFGIIRFIWIYVRGDGGGERERRKITISDLILCHFTLFGNVQTGHVHVPFALPACRGGNADFRGWRRGETLHACYADDVFGDLVHADVGEVCGDIAVVVEGTLDFVEELRGACSDRYAAFLFPFVSYVRYMFVGGEGEGEGGKDYRRCLSLLQC